jgi:hypothetical protein
MKARCNLVMAGLALGLLSSCGSPAKYSYYFSTYSNAPRTESVVLAEPIESASETMEMETFWAEEAAPLTSPGEPVVETPPAPAKQVEYLPNGMELKDKKEYTRVEKKQIRSDYRVEVKTYKKAVKEGNTIQAHESAKQLTGYTRTGVILGIAGLVLMILGTSTVASIGGLLLLIGVIFILIDVL